MPHNTRARTLPTLDCVQHAWLEATAVETRSGPLKIVSAEVYARRSSLSLDVDLLEDDTDSGPCLYSLWIRNPLAPAVVWRDLHVIAQLQAITGRKFTSFPALAAELLGMRFMATLGWPLVTAAQDLRYLGDLVAAAPIPEAADAHG